MKEYTTNLIKNIVLLGNSGSGKTTLAEAMLFNGGVIDRRGEVDKKNTASDYNPIEHENGNSVFSSVLYTEYNNKKVNIIDAPGADDFVGGAITGLHVADTALLLVNAQNGMEVGSEIHNRWAEKFRKPIVIGINHVDHEKANYDKTLDSIKESLGKNVVTIQYPTGTGSEFKGIIDVLTFKLYKFDASGNIVVVDIPENEIDQATLLRGELIEKAAENDEGLMELFFENDGLTEDEMRSGIRAGLIKRGMFPVFCFSAKQNLGVKRLLEFITNVTPTADLMPKAIDTDGKEVICSSDQKMSLFIFKSAVEPHIGEVNFFKIMSGEIHEGMDVVNSNNGSKERLSQIFAAAGKNRTKVTKMVAGDIGALVKLKAAKTNHTLTSGTDVKFPPIKFPEPKFRTAIKPVNEGDDEKMGEALKRIHEEDQTILVEHSKELKQIIVSGQGEYHINIMKWHLDHIYKIDTNLIAPKIPYRETITKIAQADYRHKKQSGGSGQFGEVHMIIEPFHEGMPKPEMYKFDGKEMKVSVRDTEEHPLPWGGKLVFLNCIVGGSIDTRFLPAILKGLMEKMEEGPLTGSYARDIRVAVYDGKMHPVDSNEISFRLAGRNAFREAFKKAGPRILEPIYDVEVLVPSERMGDVMSDLQGRRGVVQGMSSEKGFEKIKAKVPLAEMNKYSTSLSSLTGGRAMYSMSFGEYTQVPGDVQEKLLKDYEEQGNED